ncbi:MAG: hypothetical protein M1831_003712 [Alyxoria varia]|nr:MAG: hypothetical protein M1831_003712 [Alyxoria varia]
MGISTISVGAAVTPTVIETWISHYLNRKPRKQKPTAHITYDVGLHLIRQFLTFASHQTVDDLQAFTSQWVPRPTWVRIESVDIPKSHINDAADLLAKELGPEGVRQVGGTQWWQWRQPEMPLKADWIEMKKDYNLRKQRGGSCERCMLYVHGGAYFFGSVDEHRYQLQRHSRKLQARVLAPRYRLAPQFPFPCGLHDCVAVYLWLLTVQKPETIVLAGDSAGGGMVVSLLVTLRDQGIPMPAGAILLSPWVDLTHSFPSVAGMNAFDYVPPSGFQHKPSMSWPPPGSTDLNSIYGPDLDTNGENTRPDTGKGKAPAVNGSPSSDTSTQRSAVPIFKDLSVDIDGERVHVKDQIQMYTTNALLSHPLVSPVLQPTLGGLPPLCVIVGGGEMLRDEQIYLAHKAANPAAYPPPSSTDRAVVDGKESAAGYPPSDPEFIQNMISAYPPTDVQLQVWDDLCHVAPTLSFTRPAKFIYRSIAQFGAWALARAQRSEIRILNDDDVSEISSMSSQSSESSSEEASSSGHDRNEKAKDKHKDGTTDPIDASTFNNELKRVTSYVGKAGDPLEPFSSHMIRQRVTRHGEIYGLESADQLAACTMTPADVGSIKPGPVRKWLAAQERLNEKFKDELKEVRERHLKNLAEVRDEGGAIFAEAASNDVDFRLERPPPTAWAGRRREHLAKLMKARAKKRMSKGLAMWSGWGSKHDEDAIEKEEEKVKNKEDVTMSVTAVRPKDTQNTNQTAEQQLQPVESPSQAQQGNTASPITTTRHAEDVPAQDSQTAQAAADPITSSILPDPAKSTGGKLPIVGDGSTLVPFKLHGDLMGPNNQRNASTVTLTNASGIIHDPEGPDSPDEAEPAHSRAPPASSSRPYAPAADADPVTETTTTAKTNDISIQPSRPETSQSQYLNTADNSAMQSRAASPAILEEATPMTLMTPDAARREHARASSGANGGGGGDDENGGGKGDDRGNPSSPAAGGGIGGGGSNDESANWREEALSSINDQTSEGESRAGDKGKEKEGIDSARPDMPARENFVTATDDGEGGRFLP